MNKYKYTVKKIGKGTEDDPVRPDISSVMSILKTIRETVFKSGKFKNKTLFIVQVVNETEDGFEVEIRAEKPIKEIAREVGAI